MVLDWETRVASCVSPGRHARGGPCSRGVEKADAWLFQAQQSPLPMREAGWLGMYVAAAAGAESFRSIGKAGRRGKQGEWVSPQR